MIALVVALAVQASPAPPAPRLRYLPTWTEQLSGKGWPFLDIDANNSVVLFAKVDTQHSTPDHLRVLVRHEFKSEQKNFEASAPTYHSEIVSEEVDCAAGKMRALTDDRFRFANLEGQRMLYRFTDSDWRQPDPDSFDAEVLQAACERPETAAVSP